MKCFHQVNINGALFPCGRCTACRITRTSIWSLRLLHESEYWKEKVFVTLTYDDENLPSDCGLSVSDLQLFLKRFRRNRKEKIKYYACGEYGETTKRPHYHLIMFGPSEKEKEDLEDSWGKGFVHVGSVTADSIKYVCSYIQKKWSGDKGREEYGNRQYPFQTVSQGMGKRWIFDHQEKVRRNMCLTKKGVKIAIPRYYKDKLNINCDDTLEIQKEMIQTENEFFEDRNIPRNERSKVRREIDKVREEENVWIEKNLKKVKKL